MNSDRHLAEMARRPSVASLGSGVAPLTQARHMGGIEMANLWVEVYDGSVRAVIVHEGNLTIYAKDSLRQRKRARFANGYCVR